MNRVIKDLIWSSPSLAKLSLMAQLHWPRWLLMADDWGCFNADTDIIKGLVYPKLKQVGAALIEKLKDEYFNNGKLFLWSEGDRQYGFFTSWSNHQFCNATHLDDDGKQNRHKRRTPEPPQELLEEYLSLFKGKQPLIEELERVRTSADKYRIPNPNPNPNPKKTSEISKLFLGEHRNVRATREEIDKLKALATSFDLKKTIEELSDYIKSKGKDPYKDHYATLRSWLRKKGLLKTPEKKKSGPDTEKDKIQRAYESAAKNAPQELHPEFIEKWRAFHKTYPGMGWGKLLKERGYTV